MFSEELKIMDNNTARLMIDEMQSDIDKLQVQLAEQQALIEKLRAELNAKSAQNTKAT